MSLPTFFVKVSRTLIPVAVAWMVASCAERAEPVAPVAPVAAQKPDISGTWERTPDDWFGEDPDKPVLPGGKVPLKPEYAAKWEALKKKQAEADAAGKPLATTSSQCLPEGMPTMMTALFPIEIIHNDKEVVVLGEYLQQVRRIWIGATLSPIAEIQPTFQGQSVGSWEGDTLVVETHGIRTDTLLYDLPHSKNLKITERIKLKAPGHLEVQMVMEDPEIMDAPYKFTLEYKKSDYKIQEYVCENNQIVIKTDGTAAWKSTK
jgi:hypothetical protein